MEMEIKQIPGSCCLDHTCTLLKEGYLFVPNRVKRYQSDIFKTRLLGKKVICMSGKEASKIFYNPNFFKRKGALPKRVQKTLFGVSAVQTMDGRKHVQRKNLFLSVLNEEYEERLSEIAEEKWKQAVKRWENKEKIVFYDEINSLLCRIVCEWAEVPLLPYEERMRAEDFRDMVDDFGKVGPGYWQGKCARKRIEKWMQGVIEDTRSGGLKPQKNSVLYKVAFYKEDGRLLAPRMAAIELINVLRPMIAVSRYIVFTAHSLHEHMEYKQKLRTGSERFWDMYVQEVRRDYPFAPFLGAITKKDFAWNGYAFKKGTLVILDLYGTNHDACIWEKPYEFRPERFGEKICGAYEFIPQGGGRADTGHRCPGEGVTERLMKVSLDSLVYQMEYKVPDQNLDIRLDRIPASVQSGFIMSGIKQKKRG